MSPTSNGKSGSFPTAEMAAATRAFGTAAPDPRVRNPDHLASRLIPWSRRPSVAAKLSFMRSAVRKKIEQQVPGALVFETLRTRHMDSELLGEVHDGARQVVLLGAGYDSRAYRFADRLEDVAVYEVDHPGMALVKRRRVKAVLKHPPANVRYVDVDFERQDLGESLAEAGFERGVRSVVIWSGVAPYLSQAAIDRTLAWFVADNAPSSLIVFDHLYEEFIDGTLTGPGLEVIRSATEKAGEPLLSGIAAGTTETYLRARGLDLALELLPSQALERYVTPDGGSYDGPRVEEIGPFVSARVPAAA